MFTFVQGARSMTTVCLCAVAFFGASVTATADPADSQGNNDKLFALLSGGYTRGGGGPNAATYSLYGNIADLNKAFNIYGSAIPCPGTTDPGPVAWQGGRVKCGHDFYPHTSLSMLTWTRDADLVVVNVEGADLASLYAWWLSAR
jgi:hypothetical protein